MYLDAVSNNTESEVSTILGAAAARPIAIYEPWADWAPSQISHHGKLCCEIAREWVTAADHSYRGDIDPATGPRWLRHRFKWGPSSYPIHWCEAVRRKTLDCGALAALSHEVFSARGICSLRAQFVQRFSSTAASSWWNNWALAGAPTDWIKGELIYHEGCAVAVGAEEIKVWDSSAGWWIDPSLKSGYGSLAAIRVWSFDQERYRWGPHEIVPNSWTLI